MTSSQRPWWKDAVFYQIYPRSFQDSDGDGFGDIPGIISRLDEIARLGVTALWISPLYPSPDADNGYDIADYCGIDVRYGTLADFDRLVAEAGARGIRIVMDLVINHTSDEHPWFQASRRRDPVYKDYYIWRPGKPGKLPPCHPGEGRISEPSVEPNSDSSDSTAACEPQRIPPSQAHPLNNWTGFFMGSAWEWDEMRGEYCLHLFDKKQPDLNYRNPAVLAEVERILRFWLDRGVAGFRCDVISLLDKSSFADGTGLPILRGLEHYKTQPGTHAILARLRSDVLDRYDAFTVGETVMVTLDEARDLCDPDRGELDLIFYFDHLEVDRLIAKYGPKPFRADELLRRLTKWQLGLDWNAVYLENHDQPRIVSHYGDDRRFWRRSACLMAVLLLTLKGTPFIYQGQEIGMTNFDFNSIDQVDDVESRNMDALLAKVHIPYSVRWNLIKNASRDNARTPYQWDSTPGAGFTTGTCWLQTNTNATWLNYAAQTGDPSSVLNFYRRMIRLRSGSQTLREGGFEPVYADRAVMVYRRTPVKGSTDPAYTIWLNFSPRTQRLKQPWLASAVSDGPVPGPVHPPICVASTTGRRRLDGILLPWEAMVIRETTAAPWMGHP